MRRAAAVFLLVGSLLVARGAGADDDCVEIGDVVGERCARYGAEWSIERSFPIASSFSFVRDEISLAQTFRGDTRGSSQPQFRFDGAEAGLPRVTTYGVAMGIEGFFSPFVYLGGEFAWAFGSTPRRTVATDLGDLDLGSTVLSGRVAVGPGLRLPLGPIAMRFEVLVGLQAVGLSLAHPEAEGRTMDEPEGVWFLAMPRIHLEAWTSPTSTIGIFFGQDTLFQEARQVGISFRFHGRPYTGRTVL
jgi:hypothetical protein